MNQRQPIVWYLLKKALILFVSIFVLSVAVFYMARLAPGDPLPDVIVHGHTHVPELKTGPDARPAGIYLCPGAVYRPRSEFGRTLAKMDVEAGRILRTWVENLDEKVLMEA